MDTQKINGLLINLKTRSEQLLTARDLWTYEEHRNVIINEAARVKSLRGTPEYNPVVHETLKEARRELRARGVPLLFQTQAAAEEYRRNCMDPEELEELQAELSPEEAFPPLDSIAELETEWERILAREDRPEDGDQSELPRHLRDHQDLINLDPESLAPLLGEPLAPIWRDAEDLEEGVTPEQAAVVARALQVFHNPKVLAFLRALSSHMKALREPSPGVIVDIEDRPFLNGEGSIMRTLLDIRRLAADVAPYDPQGVGALAAGVDAVLDAPEYRDAARAVGRYSPNHPWPGEPGYQEEVSPEEMGMHHWWTEYAREDDVIEHGSPRRGIANLTALAVEQDSTFTALLENPESPEERARARFIVRELASPAIVNLFCRAQALFPRKLGDAQRYLPVAEQEDLACVMAMRVDASRAYALTDDPALFDALRALDDTLDPYPQALQAIGPAVWERASKWTIPSRDHWWGIRLAGEMALADAVMEGR